MRTPSPTDGLARTETLTKDKSLDQWKISGEFRYCATCGRSVGVRLTACNRCQKVYFCSKTCKLDGWNQFHRYQCRLLAKPGKTKIFHEGRTRFFSSSSTDKNFITSQGDSFEDLLSHSLCIFFSDRVQRISTVFSH